MDKYGPQTEEIKKFLDKARNLTPEQHDELGIAWNRSRNADRSMARRSARNVVWDTDRYVIWNDVRNAALHAVRDASWVIVNDAVYDIALALIVKDKISEEHFNTLYGPWKSVMEK